MTDCRFSKYLRIPVLVALMLPGLVFSVFLKASASEAEPKGPNIVERISAESDGNVIIEIDSVVLADILTDPQAPTVVKKKNKRDALGRVNGYRIQVFSDGRNQSSLEARAKARGNAIVARFPKYRGQVYTYSSAPNWYTRIGNFETEDEAYRALNELKRSFPNFSSEMRVVKSKISVR